MKIFRYWARKSEPFQTEDGYDIRISQMGGSNDSPDDANQKAETALRSLMKRLTSEGFSRERGNEYDYGTHGEIREELIDALTDDDGVINVAITRNRYGALVLNTSNVMFADVDYEVPSLGFFAALASLLGFGPKRAERSAVALSGALAGIETYAKANAKYGYHVYKTHSGLRVVLTNALFSPSSQASKDILAGLGSDPLFMRLCERQECYRARLSAKPWRVGLPRPPVQFPIETPAAQSRFDSWLARYDAVSDHYVTCEKVAEFGASGVIPEVARVLALHDRYALGSNGKPLA